MQTNRGNGKWKWSPKPRVFMKSINFLWSENNLTNNSQQLCGK